MASSYISLHLPTSPYISPISRAALQAKISEGVAAHMLQASPHLLLLSPAWYREELKPLLAEWAVFWLRPWLQARGGLSDAQIRDYALRRAPPPEAVMARLSDGQVRGQG